MVITESDVRSMVRLLGETASLAGGHAEKKRHIMHGLCDLIHADAWVWTLGCQVEPNEPQVFVGFLHGGFDDERFAHYLEAVEHKDMGRIASSFAENLKLNKGITTMRRDEMDPDGEAYKSDVAALWEKADIGSLMLTGYPLDDSSISCAAFYRKFDDELFTEREKKIVHIVLSEVDWLHLSGWPEDRGVEVPKLYPRQRVVLNLLLDGMSRKLIATHMGITENTVSGYAKDVYRHFGVNSHVDLMRKFLHSD